MTHPMPALVLNLPLVAEERRELITLSLFETLEAGQTMLICDYRDLRQLQDHFTPRQTQNSVWMFLESGPELWRVLITKSRAAANDSSSCCSGGACR